MPHPKSRHSKTRTRTRRANYKAEKPTYMACSNCGASVLYHRVCSECGFYKGNLVLEKQAK